MSSGRHWFGGEQSDRLGLESLGAAGVYRCNRVMAGTNYAHCTPVHHVACIEKSRSVKPRRFIERARPSHPESGGNRVAVAVRGAEVVAESWVVSCRIPEHDGSQFSAQCVQFADPNFAANQVARWRDPGFGPLADPDDV
jgi:hypothetical protein